MYAFSDYRPEKPILLSGEKLTIDQLIQVARHRVSVALTNECKLRISGARQIIEKALEHAEAIYGLNTDLGPLKRVRIQHHEQEEFQTRTVAVHSFPFGAELDVVSVRAMILSRINGIAKGGAGVRVELAEKLIELLNKGVHPIVVAGNSVGESDLSEMAQIALVLVGMGEAEYAGKRLKGAEALYRAGISPLKLAPKEALSLISANGFTLGLGSLAIADAKTLAQTFDLSAALALEGFGANLSTLAPASSRLKAHPGHQAVCAHLRELLDGSQLWKKGAARNLQDPLSFRCIPQVHGALNEALTRLTESMEIELNAASDNPLVDSDSETVVSVGNFDITNLAIGFDTLRIAMTHVINLANERVQKQLWSQFSGLSTGLERADLPLSRLIPLSRSIAALAAQAQSLAAPASLSCKAQIGEGIEDHASAAPLAVTKTMELIEVAQKVVCLELLISAAAVDLRGSSNLGHGTKRAFDFIMDRSPFQATNWKSACEAVLNAVSSGALIRLAESVTVKDETKSPIRLISDQPRRLSSPLSVKSNRKTRSYRTYSSSISLI